MQDERTYQQNLKNHKLRFDPSAVKLTPLRVVEKAKNLNDSVMHVGIQNLEQRRNVNHFVAANQVTGIIQKLQDSKDKTAIDKYVGLSEFSQVKTQQQRRRSIEEHEELVSKVRSH